MVGLALVGACSQGVGDTPNTGFPPAGPPSSPQSSTGGEATFGVGDGPGECCFGHGNPGCNDELVESCVCADLPACCGVGWTSECARAVDELSCGFCQPGPLDTGPDPDTGPPPPSGQDCCAAGPEPGCNDPVVESCVCAEIGFCCDTAWEEVCGSAVEALGCGHCGGVADTGGPPPPEGSSSGEPPPPPPPMGGCCEVQMTPGCTDAAVQDCVCAQDDFCCMVEWDQVCVDEVDMFMCGDCGGAMPPPGASPCCAAQGGPGCGDAAIEQCVCAVDDFCCNVEWDSVCAIFVELFLCATCS